MISTPLVSALLAGASFGLVSAAPTRVQERASSCTFTSSSEASESAKSCSTVTLSNIEVPAGETLDLTDLAEDTKVIFSGTTTFGYKEWSGPLISISGTGITVEGATDAVINFGGASWWDGEGSNGGKTKPKSFAVNDMKNSVIQNLKVMNTPIQFMAIDNADNLKIIDVTQDNSAGSSLGHNTDAFDIADSTGVYISGAVITNQDDCMAINSGTDISFTGGTCTGSHGLSIGSVGGRSDNIVENVYIADNKISSGLNGLRIKTISGDTGTVKNITFSSNTLSEITDYGIVIEQDYENGDPTGTPTNGISISELTMEKNTGTVASGATQIYILCGSGSCTDWTWSDNDITGGDVSSKCENIPSGASCTS